MFARCVVVVGVVSIKNTRNMRERTDLELLIFIFIYFFVWFFFFSGVFSTSKVCTIGFSSLAAGTLILYPFSPVAAFLGVLTTGIYALVMGFFSSPSCYCFLC